MTRTYPPVVGFGPGIGLGPEPPKPAETPYPAPEKVAHPITPHCPQKAAVGQLSRFAKSLGWNVLMTHARGCFPHASTARPGPQRDSLAVRMASPAGHRAAAVYLGGATWTWGTLMVKPAGLMPYSVPNLTALKLWIRERS